MSVSATTDAIVITTTTSSRSIAFEQLPDLVLISIANRGLDLKDLLNLRQVSKQVCRSLDSIPSLWWKYRSRIACSSRLTMAETQEQAKYICDKFGFTNKEVWIQFRRHCHEACREGRYEVFKYLFETYGLPPTLTNPYEKVYLLIEGMTDKLNLELTRYIFENIGQPDLADDGGASAYVAITATGIIRKAIEKCNLDLVKYLCELLPPPLMEHLIATPMLYLREAAIQGNLKQFQYLCGEVFSSTLADLVDSQHSPLTHAVTRGHLDIVKYIYERHPFTIRDLKNKAIRDSLFYSCLASKKVAMMEFLYETLDYDGPGQSQWPFIYHSAASHGNLEVFKYLCNQELILSPPLYKLSPAFLTDTCFKWAITYPTLDALKYLFDKFNLNLNPLTQDFHGKIIGIAVDCGELEALQFLLHEWQTIPLDAIKVSQLLCLPLFSKTDGGEGQVKTLQYLCDTFGATLVTIKNLVNFNMFVEAAMNGHMPLLEYICKEERLIRESLPTRLVTVHTVTKAFLKAVEQGHIDVVQYLYERFNLNLVIFNPGEYRQDPKDNRWNTEIDDYFWIAIERCQCFTLLENGTTDMFQFLCEKCSLSYEFVKAEECAILRYATSSWKFDQPFFKYFCEELFPQITNEDIRTRATRLYIHNGCEYSPLAVVHCAISRGDVDLLDYLRRKFTITIEDFRCSDHYGFKSIVEHGRFELLYWLHHHFQVTVEDLQVDNQCILRAALYKHELDIVQFLYERKVFTRDYFTANNYRTLRKYGHLWGWSVEMEYLAIYEFKSTKQEIDAWRAAIKSEHDIRCSAGECVCGIGDYDD